MYVKYYTNELMFKNVSLKFEKRLVTDTYSTGTLRRDTIRQSVMGKRPRAQAPHHKMSRRLW